MPFRNLHSKHMLKSLFSKLLSHITLNAAFPSRVPRPFLKPLTWPKKIVGIRLETSCQNLQQIFETRGIKLTVLKSTHFLAPCFFSIEMIMDSMKYLGQWLFLYLSKQISNSSCLPVCPSAFRMQHTSLIFF